jgi:hypothetical protein
MEITIDKLRGFEVRSIKQLYQALLNCGFMTEPGNDGIELGFVAGFRCRVNDLYTRFLGRWARVYIETDADGVGFVWYLSDHGDAPDGVVGALRAAGYKVMLPTEADDAIEYQSRVLLHDMARVPTYRQALRGALLALRSIERQAILAWLAGKLALPWPNTTEPGRAASSAAVLPGYAAIYAAMWADRYRWGWRPEAR